MFYKVIIFSLLCNTIAIGGLPQATLSVQNDVDSFQNAVQQQTFQSVLLAIEERLRNLDNIYSMQLSQTLQSKLDQYNRKLESLDVKIIRLETLVMHNLNKISENFSTKNYNDNLIITQTYRKLDNIYDGLSHTINYMNRKSDMAFDKIQNKIDTTLLRIEKMEENMMQRNSDVEAELSETLFILEDLKSSSTGTERNLLNITTILNQTVSNIPQINAINLSMQNLIKDINLSFNEKLETLEYTSSRSLNLSEENNSVLKSMKLELKEDFNEYANKVADMNADIWKRSDLADESLTIIETVVNSTKTEVQNGVRALMLQIGKLSGKGLMNNDKASLESLRKSVNLSLEKIITNQELFLESCHRVQMDESQIESEISVMLGKLIDMLEKKMTTVMKDLKNLEKAVKSHDSRTTRNIYQANTNIVTLFEKTTKNSETTEKELQDIKFYINSLFTFVQDVLPKSFGINDANKNIEVKLSDLSDNITKLISSTIVNQDINWTELQNNLVKFNDTNEKINDQIKNISITLLNMQIYDKMLSNEVFDEMRNLVSDLNKMLSGACATTINNNSNTEFTSHSNHSVDINRKNCTIDYGNLINLRADGISCNAPLDKNEEAKPQDLDLTNSVNNSEGFKKNNCILDYSDMIDIRADRNNCNGAIQNTSLTENEDRESQNHFINETRGNEGNRTTTRQDEERLKKAILEVFGTGPPFNPNATTENTLNRIEETDNNNNSTIPRPQEDEQLNKTTLEVPKRASPFIPSLKTTMENTFNKTETTPENKKLCIPTSGNVLNIKSDPKVKSEECGNINTSSKRRKNRRKMRPRLNVDYTLEYDDSTKYIDEDQLSTESSTENGIVPTKIPILENLEDTIDIM